MRGCLTRTIFAIGWLLAAPAWGQEQPKITLSLTVEQAKLIAQTLGQVGGCDRVSGMATCEAARALIREIQDQVIAQQPK